MYPDLTGLSYLHLPIYDNLGPATMLEKYTGFNSFSLLECCVQYFRSMRTPSRIDLINAPFKHFQFVELITGDT
jgi:hypothetical protein